MEDNEVAKLLADAQVGIGAALKNMKKSGVAIGGLAAGAEAAAGNLACDSGCDALALGAERDMKVKRVIELENFAASKGGQLELQKILKTGPEVAGHNLGCDSGCGSEAFVKTLR
ncbi:hypothetical protein GCM10011316_22840 [Roseibium aquae]|uniref:Uncharacterized protein n=1 Tax=Roseibium aquae TaxID=1323746 RepID=A0A916TK35_9HYPH|nr:hypothetical protein [Roseibium aquae]GGB50170.1 hypothetical protein GCM10011316_22840 [Roseibium aquae]